MATKYKAIKVDGIKHDEHRYLMEQHVGRKLNSNELVHHHYYESFGACTITRKRVWVLGKSQSG